MNIYIPLGLLLSLFCFFFRNNEKKAMIAFLLAMIVSCLFAMIRYEFGSDYYNYRDVYEGIQGADINNYDGRGMSIEKPFLFLLQLFPRFTFFVMALTLFWFATNSLFLKKYLPYQYIWIVVLYFFAKTDYFLDSLVAMRTTLCAALFIVAVYFLIRNRRLLYVTFIVIASLFHTSAIGLLPLVFLNTKNNSFLFKDIFIFSLGGIAVLSILIGHNFLVESLSGFVMDNVEELQRYSERDVAIVGQSINTLLFRVMSFCILLFLAKSGEKEYDPTMIVFYKIAVVAAIINLIMGQSLINDRYFLILNPIYILCIVSSFKKNSVQINTMITIFIFVIALYIFYNKLSKPYFVYFLDYKTIFDAPYIP